MGAINSKALKRAMKEFYKQFGREPNFDELQKLMRGEKLSA